MKDSPAEGDDRLRREAQFHDRVFVEDTRAPTDRFYSIAKPAYQRYRSLVGDQAADLDVLEYGCGPGSEAFDLARRGARIHGIDISPVAIELAHQRAAQLGLSARCTFQVMNAEALRFPDGSFDRICGSGILHHIDLQKGFSEIARTLRPNGRAIFIEPLGHNPIINLYRKRTPQMRTDDEHPLLSRDVSTAFKHFARVSPEFLQLSVLAAAPLQGSRYFGVARWLLDNMDRLLLASWSPFRWSAWLMVLVLQK